MISHFKNVVKNFHFLVLTNLYPMKEITLHEYFTSSNSYPDRIRSPEKTAQVEKNAEELLRRVNALLKHIGWDRSLKISSGFRPSSVNSSVKGAALKSCHMTGEAVDLLDDKDQTLCKTITKDLLEKFDLFREDSDATIGKYTNWCHLQTRKTQSGRRIFKP